jgi:hypothetical protein
MNTDMMVAIPAGEFMMGSLEEEDCSYDDERPQHEVSVPHMQKKTGSFFGLMISPAHKTRQFSP